MFKTLLPAKRVLPVRVTQRGRAIGAAFFLHDDEVMYFWDGASDPDALHTYPNDLSALDRHQDGRGSGHERVSNGQRASATAS